MQPEAALTLDDGQHSVGPVQGDGQAQRPQVALLMEQVVELLLEKALIKDAADLYTLRQEQIS